MQFLQCTHAGASALAHVEVAPSLVTPTETCTEHPSTHSHTETHRHAHCIRENSMIEVFYIRLNRKHFSFICDMLSSFQDSHNLTSISLYNQFFFSIFNSYFSLILIANRRTSIRDAFGDHQYLHMEYIYLFQCMEQNQISWIRRRDWHILSSGAQMYTNDERFAILHTPGSNTWTLQIKFVQRRDHGMYECQVGYTYLLILFLL